MGAHLPLIDFGDGPLSAADLMSYARCCVDLDYAALAANDHLVFPRPWIDGLTALAAVAGNSGALTLATTVALPVVRGPALLAKALASLDVLSEGRVVAAVARAHRRSTTRPSDSTSTNAGVASTRRSRYARPVARRTLRRALLLHARHHDDTETEPARRATDLAGELGLSAGLRRVADLADGWLASAYHTTPSSFAAAKIRLAEDRTAAET